MHRDDCWHLCSFFSNWIRHLGESVSCQDSNPEYCMTSLFPAVSLFNTSSYFEAFQSLLSKYLCLTVKSSQATLRFRAVSKAEWTRGEKRAAERNLFLSITTSILQWRFEFLCLLWPFCSLLTLLKGRTRSLESSLWRRIWTQSRCRTAQPADATVDALSGTRSLQAVWDLAASSGENKDGKLSNPSSVSCLPTEHE